MAIGAEELLALYAKGQFPMAENRNSNRVAIFDPDPRCILPLDALHLPRRLARTIRQNRFTVHINRNFAATISQCAKTTDERTETWINYGIEALCHSLFLRGHAHSVECYLQNQLVGGLYGVSLGGAFFGESMFSRVRDASKVALFHLCARLIRQGFCLLDIQFNTEHLEQFGAVEIGRTEYKMKLARAIKAEVNFTSNITPMSGHDVLNHLNSLPTNQ